MKKFLLLLGLITLVFGRENPFVPTQAFEEERNRLLEKFQVGSFDLELPDSDDVYIDNSLLEKQEEIPQAVQQQIPPTPPILDAKKTVSTPIVDKVVSSTKENIEPKKEIIVPAKVEEDKVDTQKTEEIVVKKPETVATPATPKKVVKEVVSIKEEPVYIKTGLKFVKIAQYNDRIEINSSPYKVFKKLNLESEKKIVFDFRADVNFLTKRIDLNHKHFKNIAIGNHKDGGFFRVVVELNEPINKYDATYSDTKVIVKYKQ